MFTRLTRLFNRVLIIVLCLVLTAQPVKTKASILMGLPQTEGANGDFVYMNSDGTVTEQFSSHPLSTRGTCPLLPPTPISPVGGTQINTIVPHFEWNGTGTDSYYILVSAFSNFSNTVVDLTLGGFSGINVSFVWSSNLLPNTTYYWKISNACSMFNFSSTAIFQTADINGPFIDPPAIISPSDGALLFPSNQFLFSWGNVPGAEAVQIHCYSSMSAAQNDQTMLSLYSNGWVNSYTDTYHFLAAGTYYWRLKVRDNIAWGPFSPVYSFTIIYPAAKIYLPAIMRP